MRVFPDTNFLISAFATQGFSATVFRYILSEHQLLTGEFVIGDLKRILKNKMKVPESEIARFEVFLRKFEVIKLPDLISEFTISDPDDAVVLQSAMNGNAEWLITGDQDLLVLADLFELPRIVTARQFWEITHPLSE